MIPIPVEFLMKDIVFERKGKIMYIHCLFNEGFLWKKWVPRTYEGVMSGDSLSTDIYLKERKAGASTILHLLGVYKLRKARYENTII